MNAAIHLEARDYSYELYINYTNYTSTGLNLLHDVIFYALKLFMNIINE